MNSLNQCSEAKAELGRRLGSPKTLLQQELGWKGVDEQSCLSGSCSSLPNSQRSQGSRCFLTQGKSHRGGSYHCSSS